MRNPLPRSRWALLVVTASVVAVLLYFSAGTVSQKTDRPDDRTASRPIAARDSDAVGRSDASPASTPTAAPLAPGVLFSYVQPANAAALSAALPAPAREIHYVRINPALFDGKDSPFWQAPGEGRLEIPLPDGRALAVLIDDSEMLGAARFTSVGHLEGHAQSQAVFAYNEGFLHATITNAAGDAYALRVATEAVSQFYRVDPALVPLCAGAILPESRPALVQAARARAAVADTNTALAPPATAAAENPQRAEIHVLFAYTQLVHPTMTGAPRRAALQSAFDAEIAKTNTVLANSLVSARIKLVGIVETQYDESVSDVTRVEDDALAALSNYSDGKLDDLIALRDQFGADIVCLAHQRADSNSGGQAYLLANPGNQYYADFAFAVIQYPSLAGTVTVPHELGHVLGCAHDRPNSGDAGAFSYSYGYAFDGANGIRYRDVLAYPPGTSLWYYSNPNVVAAAPASRPIGIELGKVGEASNAFTIEQTAFNVSRFRLQTQTAANAGTLINVSTRAFVGTGDSVLIGGFSVEGSQPKAILVRAAGPALTTFGVPDILANPILRVAPPGQPAIAENDDWSVQSTGNGAAIATIADRVGAFAFKPDSQDAALLLTLSPGAYTAVVEGAGGTSGSGLVEAYEVDRNANKVVNLSTRGYVDVGNKRMVGGFVVQGAAGATKRVLVRVLGPTLTRFGITGVLYDPVLQLYNAAGELLAENDDWTASTTSGTYGETPDRSPSATLHSEKKIAETGFAPSNRREPGLLVDLPPGNYTVIVKPLERPGFTVRPGVAIVEVYEINQ